MTPPPHNQLLPQPPLRLPAKLPYQPSPRRLPRPSPARLRRALPAATSTVPAPLSATSNATPPPDSFSALLPVAIAWHRPLTAHPRLAPDHCQPPLKILTQSRKVAKERFLASLRLCVNSSPTLPPKPHPAHRASYDNQSPPGRAGKVIPLCWLERGITHRLNPNLAASFKRTFSWLTARSSPLNPISPIKPCPHEPTDPTGCWQ